MTDALERLRRARDAPWLAALEARRLASLPAHRLAFARAGVRWGRGWRVYGAPILQRFSGSRIEIGDWAVFRSWPASNPLAPNHPVVLATRARGAEVVIGEGCGFSGTTIVAMGSVRIGDRVLVGSNATIVDTDFHPLDPEGRRRNPTGGHHEPVRIGDDVFIGMGALVLKGVTLGDGCVVGAGAVVSGDVAPGAVVAGNPAQFVRSLCGP